MKYVLKFLGYIIAAWVWWWVVIVKVPVLLTSGTLGSLFGFMLLALGMILPIYYVGRIIQRKTKEDSK